MKRIDVDSDAYKKLVKLLDNLPDDVLKQLAAEKINFISSMARNRVIRKKIRNGNVDETTTTGDVGGYNIPAAFTKNGSQEKQKDTKLAKIAHGVLAETATLRRFVVSSTKGIDGYNTAEEALSRASRLIYITDKSRHMKELKKNGQTIIVYGFSEVRIYDKKHPKSDLYQKGDFPRDIKEASAPESLIRFSDSIESKLQASGVRRNVHYTMQPVPNSGNRVGIRPIGGEGKNKNKVQAGLQKANIKAKWNASWGAFEVKMINESLDENSQKALERIADKLSDLELQGKENTPEYKKLDKQYRSIEKKLGEATVISKKNIKPADIPNYRRLPKDVQNVVSKADKINTLGPQELIGYMGNRSIFSALVDDKFNIESIGWKIGGEKGHWSNMRESTDCGCGCGGSCGKSPVLEGTVDIDDLKQSRFKHSVSGLKIKGNVEWKVVPRNVSGADQDKWEVVLFQNGKKVGSIGTHPSKSGAEKMMGNINELRNIISEATYRELKYDDSRTPKQKIGSLVKEMNGNLYRLERIVHQAAKLKTETGLQPDNYWGSTHKKMNRISERMLRIANRLREMK